MLQPLTAIHFFTPFLLSLPVLPLITPPPTPPPQLPGIRPISIQTITPRRGLTLLILSLLALTSFFDGVILVVDLLTSRHREAIKHSDSWIWGEVVYSVGGLCVWSLAAIFIEWRARWGDRYLIILGTLGLVSEVNNLVFLILREIHSNNSDKIFTILSIPPSCLRILLLPLLIVLVSSPIIRFEPADETTGLLINTGDAAEASHSREAYGTFLDENGINKPASSPTISQNATTIGTGANTPAVRSITIPKELGADKEKTPPLTWSAFCGRLKKLLPKLWPSTSPKLQLYCVMCVIFLLIGRFINPSIPLSLGAVVRALTSNQNGQTGVSPWPPFATYIALRAVQGQGLLSFLTSILWVPVSQYTDREMQLLCFNHLLNLSLAFHTKRNTGEVLKILDRGSAINNLFQTLLFTAVPTLFDIVIAFFIFFYLYGWTLFIVIAVVMTTYVGVSIWLTGYRTKLRRQMVERDVKQRGIASDVLTNWESVKYFTAEHRETKRFNEAILSYQETESKVMVSYNLLNLVQAFIITLGLLAGSIIIAFRVLDGLADAAEFVVFIQYLQQLYGPLDRLGFLYRQLNTNTTDAEKLFNLLAQPTEINDKPGAKDLVVTDGVVEFDHVCFSYDGKVQALKDVSFTIGKGQSMALVGESGSGKSTILRLLYRFYDITSGHIYIDGQDISEVTQISLRKAIGIVPQDSVLWNDTIGANIAYGKEGAEDDEIILAAKAAKLHERILSFADDYATIVGERGVRLSGGEKQRVSLARMFLKSPAILVLDEATSALDTETEREIQRALSELAKGRSSLSIAHRLSTIVNSDQIVVMKDGQVIEMGDYKTLVEHDGAFCAMWKKQIFTDAEMLAEAGGSAETVIVEAVPNPEDLIEGPNPEVEEEDKDAEAPTEPVEETQESEEIGYEVKPQDHASGSAEVPPPIAEVPEAKSFANAAKSGEAGGEVADGAESVKPEPEVPAPIVEVPEAKSFAQVAQDAEETRNEAHEEPSVEPETSAPATAPETVDSFEQPAPLNEDTSSTKPQSNVPFPSMPLPHSLSTNSVTSATSDAAPPTTEVEKTKEKDKKNRKRLSSIKGFVRRISDQGTVNAGGMSRSSSYNAKVGGGSGGNTPNLSVENVDQGNTPPKGLARSNSTSAASGTPTPDGDKKKRFSFQNKK